MENIIRNQIAESILTKELMLKDSNLIAQIRSCAEIIINAYKNNKKTLLAGNGGSAADAQHIAGEFVSRFFFDRPGLASIALTTDTSILTAIGNDYGYNFLFARQLEAQGRKGDIFIGISTSGNSDNILEALKVCKERGIVSIGLTGKLGGKMEDLCNICIKVPSIDTPRIQESHILIGHIICCLVEEALFSEYKPLK